jgi:hypothetical protein
MVPALEQATELPRNSPLEIVRFRRADDNNCI